MIVAVFLIGCKDNEDSPNPTPQGTAMQDPLLDEVFNLEDLPRVNLVVSLAQWNEMLAAQADAPRENFWIRGNLSFTPDHGNGTTTVYNGIDLRLRGNSSRRAPEVGPNGETIREHNPDNTRWQQANFAVRFGRNGAPLFKDRLERLRLMYIREDPTKIREIYAFNLHQLNGTWNAPRMSFCRLFVKVEGGNPNEAYFGVFQLMEELNQEFVDAREDGFGDNTGFLWEANNGATFTNADTINESTISDGIYTLETNPIGGSAGRLMAINQLKDFIINLNTLTGPAFKTWAENTINLEQFFKTYAIITVCGNMDDYWYNSNNFHFYFNAEGKFYYIPDDYDTVLGTGWGLNPGTTNVTTWGATGADNPLVRKLITEVPEFRTMYLNACKELVNGPFYIKESIIRIQKWHALITPYLDNDTQDPPGQDNSFGDRQAWWVPQEVVGTYNLWMGPGAQGLNFFEVRTRNVLATN